MQVNLSRTALENFLDLLNLDNPSAPVSFTEQNVSVGAPEDNIGEGGPAAKNTKVLLSAIANQGYSGTKVVKYNRLNLTGGVAELPYAIVVEPTDSAEQIRDKMAAQLGILKSEVLIEALLNGETVMSIEDLVAGGHLPDNEDDDSVQLSAWVNLPSLIYHLDDAIQIRLRVPDTDINLEAAIVNDELSGFDPVV